MSEMINLNISKRLIEEILNKFDTKELDISKYLLELIQKDIEIKNEFSFNNKSRTVFFKEIKKIELTKLEYKLFVFLLNNANRVVSIEEINKMVWENKTMSRFTLRNRVMSLRTKIYPNLIKNCSNRGYMIIL